MRHISDGNCQKCEEIFNKYPNFNPILKEWFKEFQKDNHEAHISCAGRGRDDQTKAYDERKSKAQWGDSAHNYGCAIDIFCQATGLDIYDAYFFKKVEYALTYDFTWYGVRGSAFYELPHVELSTWRDLLKSGQIRLVE